MELHVSGEIIYWRGPAPWYFVAMGERECAQLAMIAHEVTYGWGCIPVTVRLGAREFTTSLFPKDGGYLVPIKTAVRRAENLDEGEHVQLVVTVAEG